MIDVAIAFLQRSRARQCGLVPSLANISHSRHRRSGAREVVAIKVIDIDDADYHAFGESKEEQILDFQKEIRVLRNAGESDAPNLNRMIEAFAVHSQLWLICEYCPGASVKTLVSYLRWRGMSTLRFGICYCYLGICSVVLRALVGRARPGSAAAPDGLFQQPSIVKKYTMCWT